MSEHIYNHVKACHLNSSAHQIKRSKIFLVLFVFFFYKWKGLLNQLQQTQTKRFLTFCEDHR